MKIQEINRLKKLGLCIECRNPKEPFQKTSFRCAGCQEQHIRRQQAKRKPNKK